MSANATSAEQLDARAHKAAAHGDWRKASDCWGQASRLMPNHSGTLFSYARACTQARRYRKAEPLLRQLLGRLEPTDELEARVYLCVCLCGQRRWDEAVGLCNELAPLIRTQRPSLLPYLLGNLALAEYRRSRLLEAEAAAGECISLTHGIKTVWKVLLYIRIRQRRLLPFLRMAWAAASEDMEKQDAAKHGT